MPFCNCDGIKRGGNKQGGSEGRGPCIRLLPHLKTKLGTFSSQRTIIDEPAKHFWLSSTSKSPPTHPSSPFPVLPLPSLNLYPAPTPPSCPNPCVTLYNISHASVRSIQIKIWTHTHTHTHTNTHTHTWHIAHVCTINVSLRIHTQTQHTHIE